MAELLFLHEVATRWGVGEDVVRDLVDSGAFKAFGMQKNIIRAIDVDCFLRPCTRRYRGTSVTLTDIMDEMLDVRRARLEGNTIDTYQYMARHIRFFFKDRRIVDIRQKDIELFYQSLHNRFTDKRLKLSSAQTAAKILKMVYEYAYQNQYIERPFAFKNIQPTGEKIDKDKRFLSKEAAAELLWTLRDHPKYYTLIRLLLATGLRIDEALALRYTDFDRPNQCIHVQRALKRGEIKKGCTSVREIVIGIPKSQRGNRNIPVPEELLNLIANWRLRRCAELTRKKVPAQAQEFVFINNKGELADYRAVSKNFQLYLKRHAPQTMQHVTFHMLRHTYGSLLLEKGISLAVVSEFLGHSKVGFTASVYITITKQLYAETAQACCDILKEIDEMAAEWG